MAPSTLGTFSDRSRSGMCANSMPSSPRQCAGHGPSVRTRLDRLVVETDSTSVRLWRQGTSHGCRLRATRRSSATTPPRHPAGPGELSCPDAQGLANTQRGTKASSSRACRPAPSGPGATVSLSCGSTRVLVEHHMRLSDDWPSLTHGGPDGEVRGFTPISAIDEEAWTPIDYHV